MIVSGNWIDITTNNSNEGVFQFEKPITNINHLSITFRSPIHPINFDIDWVYQPGGAVSRRTRSGRAAYRRPT